MRAVIAIAGGGGGGEAEQLLNDGCLYWEVLQSKSLELWFSLSQSLSTQPDK